MSDISVLRKKIIEKKPIVHYIPNVVTAEDCANVILALGASVTMAHNRLDVEEITSECQALVINLGGTDCLDAMMIAGRMADKLGHPIVLDPVGVAGSAFRRRECLKLMNDIHFSCIRGNVSEIRALMEDSTVAAGIDALDGEAPDMIRIAKYAKKFNTIIVVSGKTDNITDGTNTYTIESGDDMMSRITGTGCMLSAVIGAFLCVEQSVDSVSAACEYMGNCGKAAADKTRECGGGTGTFKQLFMDEISLH